MITYKELITSGTAIRNKLNNNPDLGIIPNLCDILAILNCVRTKYGKPIKITSGYRSPDVNKKVGGVKDSAHMYGLAVDVQPIEKNLDNYLTIQNYFISFASQLGYNVIVIHEYPKNDIPSWLHLEISKVKPSKIFTINEPQP